MREQPLTERTQSIKKMPKGSGLESGSVSINPNQRLYRNAELVVLYYQAVGILP